MTAGRRWALLAAAAILIGAAGGMVHSSYILGILIFIALNGMAALGLSLVMGFAGQVSLGQAAFYAIGAYVSGVLTASYGWNGWLSVAAAVLAGAVAARGRRRARSAWAGMRSMSRCATPPNASSSASH